jgi:signal transduction histidine kinase
VRLRVTAAATLLVLVVLVGSGLLIVRAQEQALQEGIDDRLEATTEALAGALEAGQAPVLAIDDDDDGFRILDVGGDVLASAGAVPPVDPAAVLGGDDEVTFTDGGQRVRVEAVDERVVIAAADLEDVEESVDALARSLSVAVPLTAATLAVLLWFVVGRTLRPVEAIRAEVAAIGGRDLHRRVPEPAGDDEVARLARTMNGMLGRIEEASARQQRFVADASHELRSPLTRMRTELEVDLAHPDRATPAATQQSVLEETIGLQHLVDDLLHLARSDAGAARDHDDEPVDLASVVARAAAGRAGVDVDGVTPGIMVMGRATELRRLVTNLLDNAERHARTEVTVTLASGDGVVELVVADDGPGIPTADVERVFERFTRLDASRTAGTGGAGLGLAIARDIAEAHGGTITVDGARFTVRLPTATRSGGEPGR